MGRRPTEQADSDSRRALEERFLRWVARNGRGSKPGAPALDQLTETFAAIARSGGLCGELEPLSDDEFARELLALHALRESGEPLRLSGSEGD